MQHKAELGYKTMKQVTVSKPEMDDNDAFVDPALLFWVEDASEPVQNGDKKGAVDDGAKMRKHIVRVHML